MADMCKVFVHTEKTSLPRRLKVPKTIGEKDFMSAVTRKLDLEQKRHPGTDSEIKLILAEEGEDVEPLFDSYCWPLEEDFINIRRIEVSTLCKSYRLTHYANFSSDYAMHLLL